MPPRRKTTAAATDGGDAQADSTTTTRAMRSSARVRAAVAATTNAAPAAADPPKSKAKPASKAKKPASKATATKTTNSKGKGKKRARDEDEEEDEEEPEAKKAKTDDIKDDIAKNDTVEEEEEAEEEEAPKKMVTVMKRGAAPVDPCSGFVNSHQVYANTEGVWDAMLNQTDVGNNANKFYVIQLLHPVGNDSNCILFTRWGRVGENGQQQNKGPFPSSTAVAEFKKQFKNKTSVNWEQRHGMVARKGKYTWLERSFEDEDKDEKPKSSRKKDDEGPGIVPDSKLADEVQILCRLIFSTKLMDAHLSSMNYDANKLPLGKLAKSTILNGFAALKSLSEVIASPNGDTSQQHGGFRRAVEDLTGRYYSIIPHVFGRNRPTVIDNEVLLKRELELVDALGDMEVASKLIQSSIGKDENGKPINPIDSHFRSLNLTKMDPVTKSTTEWDALTAYVRDTHGQTHHMQAQVMNAFRVERQEETDAWVKAGNGSLGNGERLLLWHGSRTTNFAGILKQGLRIAPPEAPVTGYMFGKGVYFADMMSKSANYCYAHLSDDTGLMLLCEVAAKPFYEQKNANYNADQGCKTAGARATKGLGRTQPQAWQDAGEALMNEDLKGCFMPRGPPSHVPDPELYLQYNEYIVYDPSQIRLRYLLMVKMN